MASNALLRGRCSGKIAGEVDEGCERRRWVSSIGIIEAQRRERGRPVFKDTNQAASHYVLTNVGFHEEADPDIVQYRHAREAGLVQRHRAIDIDLYRLPLLFELPAKQRSIG